MDFTLVLTAPIQWPFKWRKERLWKPCRYKEKKKIGDHLLVFITLSPNSIPRRVWWVSLPIQVQRGDSGWIYKLWKDKVTQSESKLRLCRCTCPFLYLTAADKNRHAKAWQRSSWLNVTSSSTPFRLYYFARCSAGRRLTNTHHSVLLILGSERVI